VDAEEREKNAARRGDDALGILRAIGESTTAEHGHARTRGVTETSTERDAQNVARRR
jgi:hypothetical protein